MTDFDSEYNYERGVEDVITWLKNVKRDQGHYKDKLGREVQYGDFPTLIRTELLEPYKSKRAEHLVEQRLQSLSDRIEALERRQQ